MHLLFLLLLPSVALSGKLSVEENESLKANCGDHYLKSSGVIEKSFGTPVEKNTYPWIAAIKYFKREWVGGCSAVQISTRHILTAAHCVLDMKEGEEKIAICDKVKPEDRSPEFYSRIIISKPPPENFTFYASSSCDDYLFNCNNDEIKFKISKPPFVHEEFEACELNNDLALVELDQDIPSRVGSPICMIDEDTHLAEELTAIGYGKDPYRLFPDALLLNRLEMMKIDSKDVEEVKLKRKLKASLKEKGMCHGDSGGPLVQFDQKRRYSVIGIFSSLWPRTCFVQLQDGWKRESHFIDLRYYTDWICTHTGVCPIEAKTSQRDHLSSLL